MQHFYFPEYCCLLQEETLKMAFSKESACKLSLLVTKEREGKNTNFLLVGKCNMSTNQTICYMAFGCLGRGGSRERDL